MAPPVEFIPSRHLPEWMAEQRVSLAFTTYQIGKIFFLGVQPSGQLSIFERTLDRCMGLFAAGDELHVATKWQIWHLRNVLGAGEERDGYDALYLPQASLVTGDLDVHDMVVGDDGRLRFANTLFNCVATSDPHYSFTPIWIPPFISKLANEDRCHLNGLALRGGSLRYVSLVGESDVVDGWRDQRVGGGSVYDVASNEAVVTGLSMPHSPRWHSGKLWLLNSGTGELSFADLESGRFEALAFAPGYLRGLAFAGDHAVVGLSRPREGATFSGLPLDGELERRGAEARCGLQIIDTRTGDCVHWLRINGLVEEIYDVAVLPGVRRPMMIGFRNYEIERTVSIGPPG
jgi:uncharacterized protein (TIGR03032 family)